MAASADKLALSPAAEARIGSFADVVATAVPSRQPGGADGVAGARGGRRGQNPPPDRTRPPRQRPAAPGIPRAGAASRAAGRPGSGCRLNRTYLETAGGWSNLLDA